ncbi:outer membrane beta-barrel protein [Chryseobacterium sp. RP-3-3]|uniref:Outer membrane beta-barrel protein n=1 Tax=Chryseobacterium antibioticum TaxID=2728847 RepID=A0A7Y0AM19_9FLAO|nr:outer membrane beta-barrel family protein [Chryseobacterium antibioticum]NML69804.1 outer membrane beta-barrel protein [Chryseobacterium antibioticum]
MKKLLKTFIFYFLFVGISLHAQYSVSGIVTDGSSNKVSDLPLFLRAKSDSSIIANATTAVDGRYIFKNIPQGNYILQILDPKREQFKNITLEKNLQLDFLVSTEKETAIEGIVIKSQRKFITRELNKTTINISNSIYKSGDNGYTLMNVIPGVNANIANGIQYRGQQGVSVYINGTKVRMSGAQLQNYLKTVSSASIEKIEFISETGAEFEGDEKNAVVNIILKKNYNYGLSGYVYQNTQQHRYTSLSSGFGLNYKTNKVNYFISHNNYFGKSYSDNDETQRYLSSGLSTIQKEKYVESPTYNDFKFGIDYELSSHQVLAADYTYSINKTNSSGKTDLAYIRNSLDSLDYIENDKKINLKNHLLNVSYKYKLDTLGSKLEAGYNYIGYFNIYSSAIKSSYFTNGNTERRPSDFLNINNPVDIDLHIAYADLSYVFNENNKIQLGTKYSSSTSKNEIEYSSRYQSSNYTYKESIFSMYSSYQSKIGTLVFNAGGRLEHTKYNGEDYFSNYKIAADRWNFFPSVFVQKNLQNGNINVSYNRKITRPSFQLLNPFKDIEDTRFINVGNPSLMPFFKNNYKISYLLNNKYSFDLGYSTTKGVINEIYYLDPIENITYKTYANLNKEKEVYWNVYIPIDITKWFKLNIFTSNSYKELMTNNEKITLLSPYYSLSAKLTLPSKYYLDINYDYKGKSLWNKYFLESQQSLNFTLRKSFFNDSFSLSFDASDPFRLRKIKINISESDFTRNIINRLPTTFYSLSMTYNFNYGKKNTQREQFDNTNEEQQKRLNK